MQHKVTKQDGITTVEYATVARIDGRHWNYGVELVYAERGRRVVRIHRDGVTLRRDDYQRNTPRGKWTKAQHEGEALANLGEFISQHRHRGIVNVATDVAKAAQEALGVLERAATANLANRESLILVCNDVAAGLRTALTRVR